MKVKVIVFDLDDTLYDELDYVRSGLQYTAAVLSERFNWEIDEIQHQLINSLKVSRDKIFDRVLIQRGIYEKGLIDFCVNTYRNHRPIIHLSNEVKHQLDYLSRYYPIYIVTDGHQTVQKMKLTVLGLMDSHSIKKCYVTYEWGHEFAKPSTKCFEMIIQEENCLPQDVVYIGDNPDKDFIGIKPLGLRTIRVMKGQHKHKKVSAKKDAEFHIADISTVNNLLTNKRL